MSLTSKLAMPYIMAAQAQKHVTHNEALRKLDAIVQLSAIGRDFTSPPAAPLDGDRHIVGKNATGAWSGHDEEIVAWQDGSWMFYPPQMGWLCWISGENELLVYDGATWNEASGKAEKINPVPLIGINAVADENNRLLVSSPATLFNHEGGSHYVKINKKDIANTASLLYQTNYSGRAECGIAGDDDFRVKVSPDGSSWFEGIVINKDTGAVSFPNTQMSVRKGGREQLKAIRNYYVRKDGSDNNNGLKDDPDGAFSTIKKAVDVATLLDTVCYGVIINVRDGSYDGPVILRSYMGDGPITIIGNVITPEKVMVVGKMSNAIVANSIQGNWVIKGLQLKTHGEGDGIRVENGSNLAFGHMDFADVTDGHNHIKVLSGGIINVIGDYKISGNAQYHVFSHSSGKYFCENRTVTLFGKPRFIYFSSLEGLSHQLWTDVKFINKAVGARYIVNQNSLLCVSGDRNYFPGNKIGRVRTGGKYLRV